MKYSTKIIVSISILFVLAALIINYFRTSLESLRSDLGQWNISILDAHRIKIGSGRINFIADHWRIHYTWKPPFVLYAPVLKKSVGDFELTTEGVEAFSRYGDQYTSSTYQLINSVYNPVTKSISSELDIQNWSTGIIMTVHYIDQEWDGSFTGNHHDTIWIIPYTAVLKR